MSCLFPEVIMTRSWQQDPTEIPSRIEIFLGAPGQEPVLCSVQHLTIHGATVLIGRDDAPWLSIGGAVELFITDIPTGTSVVVPGITEIRNDKDLYRSYRVRFTDAEAVEGLLHPGLVQIFDRREAFRARPENAKPIEVTVLPPANSGTPMLRTDLVDLSSTGLAIDVPVDFETEMILFEYVDLSFTADGELFELVGYIRHRSWKEEDRVRYGIEFSTRSEALEAKQERLSAWVLRRQLTLKKTAA